MDLSSWQDIPTKIHASDLAVTPVTTVIVETTKLVICLMLGRTTTIVIPPTPGLMVEPTQEEIQYHNIVHQDPKAARPHCDIQMEIK